MLASPKVYFNLTGNCHIILAKMHLLTFTAVECQLSLFGPFSPFHFQFDIIFFISAIISTQYPILGKYLQILMAKLKYEQWTEVP